MKRFALSLFGVSIIAMMPVIAGAAGTYYNGNLYQNPQRSGYSNGGYYNSYGAGRAYGQNQQMPVYSDNKQGTAKKQNVSQTKQGFQLGASFTHEFANWDFEMKNAKSKLRYDNLRWNVVSGEGAYYFGSQVPMQIKVGGRYGVQFGETSMIDDDISRGGYGQAPIGDLGVATGYAMSIGTSKDGTQFGYNAAFGLTDFLSVGRAKITPSIGYRYFKHTMQTKGNSGLTMDVFNGYASHPFVNCIEVNGETQCDPYIALLGTDGYSYYTGRAEETVGTQSFLTDYIVVPDGVTIYGVQPGDTYYYSQSGTSHKYETEWYGPYVALDMEYEINKNNLVSAGIEFGLPMYDSKGDQPYRVDWAHPTSVEDKGKFGKAYHLGLTALWTTALTDSTCLSLGMTYDYYRVNDADATTYINQSYYRGLVTDLQSMVNYLTSQGADSDLIAAYQSDLNDAQDNVDYYDARGWKLESKGEVESVYSSMGMRIGINVKF